jgi:HAD superfamily hydrolase (TIGR01549 family)
MWVDGALGVMTYDAVVFDHDGVLVRPVEMERLSDAARRAFHATDVTDPDPGDVEQMAFGPTPAQVRAVCDRYGLDPEQFWRERERSASRAQRRAVRDGVLTVYDDAATVRSVDAPRGIVSSNQRETIDFFLDTFGYRDAFDTVYAREPTLESLDRKKPSPYYVERALSDLGASSALFVGDSESDIQAAENVGIDSAFVRRPHRADLTLAVTPTYEIPTLSDLLSIPGVPVGQT